MELRDDLLRGANAAAKFTGLEPRTIYHLAAAGLIPHKKMGGILFFRKSELENAFSADRPTLNDP